MLLAAVYWRTDLTLRQLAPLFGISKSVVSIESVGILPGAQPSTSSKRRAAMGTGGRPRSLSWSLMVAWLNSVRCASSLTEMPSASRNSVRAFASRSDSSLMPKAFRITNAGSAPWNGPHATCASRRSVRRRRRSRRTGPVPSGLNGLYPAGSSEKTRSAVAVTTASARASPTASSRATAPSASRDAGVAWSSGPCRPGSVWTLSAPTWRRPSCTGAAARSRTPN